MPCLIVTRNNLLLQTGFGAWRRAIGAKRPHIDDLAVARRIEIGKPRALAEAHAVIEVARVGISIRLRGIGIDALGASLGRGGLGAGVELSAKPLFLLLRRNGDPIKLE